MQTFFIYPKCSEFVYPVDIERFEVQGDHVELYNSDDQPSDYGFLNKKHIAAIVAERPIKKPAQDLVTFNVYLKDRTDPVEVMAHVFSPSLEEFGFYWVRVDGLQKISNLYFDRSEVVIVIPDAGLQAYLADGDISTNRSDQRRT